MYNFLWSLPWLSLPIISAHVTSSTSATYATRLERRDQSTLTATIGSLANYIPSTPPATPLSGNTFSIVPRSQPTNGLDIFFSPQLSQNMEAAVRENCPKSGTDWKKCQESVSKIISPKEIEAQRHTIGSLIVIESGTLGTLGYIIALWRLASYGTAPVSSILQIHIPGPDLAQLQSAGEKDTAIFPTATNDANAPTLIIQPTYIPRPKLTVGRNGDVTLHLGSDLAGKLNELFGKIDHCSKKRIRAPPVEDCLREADMNLFRNIEHGVAAPLALFRDAVPVPVDPSLQQRVQGVAPIIAQAVPPLGLIPIRRRPLLELGVLLLSLHATGVVLDETYTWAKGFFSQLLKDCPTPHPKCSDKDCVGLDGVCIIGPHTGCSCQAQCPPEDRTPSCVNCGGEDGTSAKCIGLREYQYLWSNCECIPDKTVAQTYLRTEVEEAQKFFKNPNPKGGAVSYYCSGTRNAGVTIDEKEFPNVFTNFCKDIDMSSIRNVTLPVSAQGDPKKSESNQSRMTIVWTPKNGLNCSQPCTSIFSKLRHQEDCVSGNKAAQNAAYLHRCGGAQWSIRTPADLPDWARPPQIPTGSPNPEPTALSLGPLQCKDRGAFKHSGNAGLVDANDLYQYAKIPCGVQQTMKSGDTSIRWQIKKGTVAYMFTIGWKSFCKTKVESQNVMQPLPDRKDLDCMELLSQTWRKCKNQGDNSGEGGSIEAGCMHYEFAATYL